jgi:hypothetical protein
MVAFNAALLLPGLILHPKVYEMISENLLRENDDEQFTERLTKIIAVKIGGDRLQTELEDADDALKTRVRFKAELEHILDALIGNNQYERAPHPLP